MINGNIQLSSGYDILSSDNFAVYDTTSSIDRFAFSTSNIYNARGTGSHIFQITGTEHVRITNTGSVGIGTASPGAYKLAVVGTQFTNFIVESTQTGSYIQLKSSAGSAFLSTPVADAVGFHTSSAATERMRIHASGGVSINNSTDPGVGNLRVNGTTATANGLVGTPAYTFIDDLNTGMWTPAADTLALSTGGSERVRVDSSGNVGIGTTSPTLLFQVSSRGGMGADGVFQWGSALTGNSRGVLTWDTDKAIVGTPNNLIFATNGTTNERMRIDSSGNVGIGTTAPDRPLHVYYGPTTVGAYTMVLQGRVGGYGAGISFQSQYTGGALAEMARITADGESSWGTTAVTQDAGLRFYTALDGVVAEKMRLDSSGYLGIGTTAAQTTLHVVGTVSASLGAAGAPTYAFIGDLDTGMWSPAANTVAFSTGGTERMRIESGGNIAIGTGTASYKVDVAGVDGTGIVYRTSTRSIGIGSLSGEASLFWGTGTPLRFFGGTEFMRIDSSGNVGIGTASPSSFTGYTSLTVNNVTNGGLIEATTGGTRTIRMQSMSSGAALIGTVTNHDMSFMINGSVRATIDTSGNVGIGTSSPAQKLQVVGTQPLRIGTATDWFQFTQLNSNIWGWLSSSSLYPLVMNGATGNVGVGVNAPAVKLDVSGAITATGNITTGGVFSAALGAVGTPSYTFTGDLDTGIWSPAANTVAFSTGGSERMRIDGSGNVGIGTTTPRANLSIGTANSTATVTRSLHLGYSAADFCGYRITNVCNAAAQAAGTLTIQRGTTAAWVDDITITNTGNVSVNGVFAAGNTTLSGTIATPLGTNAAPSYTFTGDLNTGMWSPAADTIAFSTGGIERARIRNNGLFGINVDAGAMLHARGVASDTMALIAQFDVLGVTAPADSHGLYLSADSNTNIVQLASTGASAGGFTFLSGNSERVRIAAAGSVGIGNNAPAYLLHVQGTGFATGDFRAPTFVDSDNTAFYFDGAATSVANNVQITTLGVGTAASGTTGEIRATNNITAYYSDDRLKTRISNIDDALNKVLSLNGFYYEANEVAQAFGYEKKKEVGISAQEVQRVLPEIVVPAPIDENYLTVRYEKMIPLLIEAIKQQQEHINKLESKLNSFMDK